MNDRQKNAHRAPAQEWLETASAEELIDGVEYLAADVEYLRSAAAKYAATPGQEWIAERVLANAAHSEGLANAAMVKAKEEAA